MAVSNFPGFNELIELLWRPPGLSRKTLRDFASCLRQAGEFFEKSEASLLRGWRHFSAEQRQALKRARTYRGPFAKNYISFRDSRFPQKLERLPDPPCGFYYRGDARLLSQAGPWIGVVGTRQSSVEALRECRRLVSGLKPCAPVIVSGLAAGIDGAAHRAALDAGIPTVGVLGSSLEKIYPVQHRALARDMAREGLLLSELAPRSPTHAWHFPQRNRLIAAFSDLLIVVEAPEKSGALITADFALDLGIDIYVLPGRAGSAQNRGGHRLIQDGARLLMDPEEILSDLGWKAKAPLPPPRVRKESDPDREALGEQEWKLLKMIGFQPVHVDKIADMSHLPTALLLSLIQRLVLQGWLEEWPGKYFGLHPAHRELLSKA